MANRHQKLKEAEVESGFRYLADIQHLSDHVLESNGYYRGFACPHNHVIRDTSQHWCYFCVKKILSNVCGFDINYIHTDYKIKYHNLWRKINIQDMDNCWEIKNDSVYIPKRVCLPSYRSFYSKQKSENVTIHKAIYQCAWGDIGTHVVTRICGNPLCANPLHLVSSWNRLFPPGNIHPLITEFEPEKLMLYSKQKGNPMIIEKTFRSTIANPLEHREPDE
jgi:hypothetical protein